MTTGRTYTVTTETPLLEFLMEVCRGQSRTGVKSLLAHGAVTVNGRRTTSYNHPLHCGDEIVILGKDALHKELSVISMQKDIRILYEDDYIIVVRKRAGLLTVSADRDSEKTAYSILTDYVRESSPEARIFIVHRIDRDTSGILLFAKDAGTKEKLQEKWDETVLERKYVALTEGVPRKDKGTIISWLQENMKSMKVHSCRYDNGGKKAITHYRLIGASHDRKYALVELELGTGRKNQIRVHLSDIGHPIAGDRKYGARTNPAGRLALHARSLVFLHPQSGKTMKFDTGIPDVFISIIKSGK